MEPGSDIRSSPPSGVPEITFREAAGPGDRAGAVAVRRAVFIQEQAVPPELEMDQLDDSAIHLVALVGDLVVGTARMYPDHAYGPDAWHIGRVAVLLPWRQQRIGTRLMDLAATVAGSRGAHTLVLNSQLAALAFYEGLGFRAERDVFYEAGIPHRTMRRSLTS